MNPAFEKITGLARDRVVGRKAAEIYGTGSPPYLDVYAQVEDHARAYAAGYGQHLAKPVAPDALIEAVASLARARA